MKHASVLDSYPAAASASALRPKGKATTTTSPAVTAAVTAAAAEPSTISRTVAADPKAEVMQRSWFGGWGRGKTPASESESPSKHKAVGLTERYFGFDGQVRPPMDHHTTAEQQCLIVFRSSTSSSALTINEP